MSCTTFCGCDGVARNTGTPNRQLKIQDGTMIAVVPLVADDGTENKILRSDTLNQAYFQAKVNAPDPSKRWYLFGPFTNVANARAESSYETFSDDSRSKLRKGIRNFVGWLIGYSPVYESVIESLSCLKIGAYLIDDCGQITGVFCPSSVAANDALKPIPMNESTMDGLVVLASDAEAGRVQMSFDFSRTFKDSSLRILTSTEMGGANLLNLTKLIQTDSEVASESTTGFELTITVDYDSWTAVPVNGLTIDDFYIVNQDLDLVTITSVSSALNVYTFVVPVQPSGDVLTLTQSETTAKPFGISATVTIP